MLLEWEAAVRTKPKPRKKLAISLQNFLGLDACSTNQPSKSNGTFKAEHVLTLFQNLNAFGASPALRPLTCQSVAHTRPRSLVSSHQMPQLDLDHLVRSGASGHGESGCECETAAESASPGSDYAGAVERGGDVSARARGDDGDTPAESVLLLVRDGIRLAELFGAALRRDGSTKGSSNPKAAAEAATRKQSAPRAAADSTRRLAAASKTAAVVIGVLPAAGKVVVPKEPRRAAPGRVAVAAAARAWCRPAAGTRVFASEAVGPEPVSPKVSCLGAVLPETRAAAAMPGSGKQDEEEEERGGCWASVSAALRGGLCCDRNSDPREGEPGGSESCSKGAAPESQTAAAVMSPPRLVAGLGDVRRLASRRWPETMAVADEGRGLV